MLSAIIIAAIAVAIFLGYKTKLMCTPKTGRI